VGRGPGRAPGPATPARGGGDGHDASAHSSQPAGDDDLPELSPQQFAQRVLDAVDPSTQVAVDGTAEVAGRAAYRLVLSPRSDASTVEQVVISVDAATGLPLEVAVTAKAATRPAVDVGFTSLSLARPADATFAFTPPPGATVTEAANPSGLLSFSPAPGPRGGHHRRVRRPAPGTSPPTQPTVPGGSTTSPARSPDHRPVTVGSGWDAVVVFDHVDVGPAFGDIVHGAPAVTLATGETGHLVTTALVNVVVLDDGRVAVGAVDPAALEAAIPAP
jgi:hypothetical protein